MAIEALNNLPEHLIDHAALGVKSPKSNNFSFSVNGFIMNDGTDTWRITIDSSGNIIATKIIKGLLAGQPIGLLLGLTYAN